ncbi:MAG: NAD(P)/FAD-dependent oxidoreductase [Bacteroidota bacterium]|nr:NAD(P)/FAD-dependent oxidoreductase [Bacteroidota bacterium]
MLEKRDYDAVVIGSGPNGLAAAIAMQREGLSVIVIEGKASIGGGMRTEELTLPGYHHDVCSAIHPLGADSPFFRTVPLEEHGMEWIYPHLALAHPLDDGTVGQMYHSIEDTAKSFGIDGSAYIDLMQPFTKRWNDLVIDILGPLRIPNNPLLMARFGLKAMQSATGLANATFKNPVTKGFFAGLAAHSMIPLDKISTSAIGLVLGILGHHKGWPLPKGGSQKIADAMVSYFKKLGGTVETNHMVKSLKELPSSHALIFDTNTIQMMKIAGHKFSSLYKFQLNRFKYGVGVFKVDYAYEGKIPFKSELCKKAGTVHLGGTIEEIARSEKDAWLGKHSERPFVLLTQQSTFDDTRAPEGKSTVWAYCHVPQGSPVDMSAHIDNQIERFAPGFKERILARHTISAAQYESHNPNYYGGDINAGAQDVTQIFTRPALRLSPYATSAKGIYICSSSTPPGGGVHGMCGYYAAKKACKDIFGINLKLQ